MSLRASRSLWAALCLLVPAVFHVPQAPGPTHNLETPKVLVLTAQCATPAAAVITDPLTQLVWLTTTNAWGPADGKSELIPLSPIKGTGTNVAALQVAALSGFLSPRVQPYAVTLHPVAGGTPFGPATMLPPSVVTVSLAVSVGP